MRVAKGLALAVALMLAATCLAGGGLACHGGTATSTSATLAPGTTASSAPGFIDRTGAWVRLDGQEGYIDITGTRVFLQQRERPAVPEGALSS